MPNNEQLKLLFVINPVSGGKGKVDCEENIQTYFSNTPHHFEVFKLSDSDDEGVLDSYIAKFQPDKIIAVGGDGTIKLVAERILNKPISLGILPAGSANGMAKELNLPLTINEALDVINNGVAKKIDVILINEKEISIHLSDIGLNALLIKYYEKENIHGMWGYAKVVFKVFAKKRLMKIELDVNNQKTVRAAYMIIIANAQTYGTGVIINPAGNLYDGKFEVIIVRKLSLWGLFKMLITHKAFDPANIEVLQTKEVSITTRKANDFQVDGEYCGKINNLKAIILPAALNILLPDDNKKAGINKP